MANEAPPLLFDDCHVAIIPSRELTIENAREFKSILEENGATISELGTDGTVEIFEVTHIISSTSDFPQYHVACEHLLPVIAPSWIAASLKKSKLAPFRPYTPDPKLFFSGVNVTCADIPEGDQDAIIGAVLAMGGQESSSLTRQVTHIVALTEDHPKCQNAKDKQLKCKIVLPHWFEDCIKLGHRIDEKPYLLPDPEFLRMGSEAQILVPVTNSVTGATTPVPDYIPVGADSPSGSRQLGVFREKKVMFSEDVKLRSRHRGILEDLITNGGGAITTSVYKADMYICNYRDGDDYITASRNGKDVGNLSWLYYLMTYNEWTSPLRRLLHYPVPRMPLEGFEGTRITLSNYGGDTRIYLESLVKAAGGEFTKSMKQDNTHLITARNNSEKCEAALEWGISMVNHLWIEESYVKCKAQPLTNPKYTHFPRRTNLGEVIGQVPFDRAILERIYYPGDVATPESLKRDRPVMKTKDRNAGVQQATEPISSALADVSMADDQDQDLPVLPRSKATPVPKRTAHLLSTPHSSRLVRTGKENETPSSASSRGAKDRALSKLHDQAADIALYEKEKKRASSGVWGGKRAADQVDRERGTRKASSEAGEESDAESEEEGRVIKKAKTGSTPVRIRLLVTSYKRWEELPAKEDSDKKKLRELGILVVQDPTTCNYLAAPGMVRTHKFLCALATGVGILSTDFIDACLTSTSLPTPESFVLKDKAKEKHFKVKLADAVNRAKSNSGRLLRGIAVYCTEAIPNGSGTYKTIVEFNGGEFAIFRAKAETLRMREEGEEEAVYLLTGTSIKEKALWPKFTQMAEDNGHEARIVQVEWLLDAAMRQEVKWHEAYLAK
ncbi:hypothetical protein V494_05061 [Pseudogymnoascus sp. VKM F-4513 (FW-928)]|nr:hypothetical protein V494_05061 [Pseudogymnoascus sp. VKM F-4513 (FW-928)]